MLRLFPRTSAILPEMVQIHLSIFRSNQSYQRPTWSRQCTFQTEPPPTWLLVSLFGLFNWRGRLDFGLHGISTVRYADTDYAVRFWGSNISAPPLTPQMLADSYPVGPESIATLRLPKTQVMTTFTSPILQATNLPSTQPWPSKDAEPPWLPHF